MSGALLRSGNLREYTALGAAGRQIYSTAPQVRATIKRMVGAEQADMLAIPQINEAGDAISWYAPDAGAVVPWSAATEDERAPARQALQRVREEFLQRSESLLAASNKSQDAATFARMLPYALHIPDESHIYLVGDKPVVTFWGFDPLNAGPNADVIRDLRPPTPQEAAAAAPQATPTPPPPPPPPPPVPPAAVVAAEKPWWRWLLWLLPFLLLLLLLLFLLFGLKGCEDPVIPVPDALTEEEAKPDEPPVTPPADPLVEPGAPVQPDSGMVMIPDDPAPLPYFDYQYYLHPDGTLRYPDGTLVPPGTVLPDGTVVPDDSILDGMFPEGTEPDAPQPEGVEPDAVNPDAVDPEARDPNATDPVDQIPPAATTPEGLPPPDAEVQDAPRGEELTIPEEAVEQGNTDFLNGRWRSHTGLADRNSGEPVRMEYAVQDGKGVMRIYRSDGTVCEGGMSATMDGSTVVFDQTSVATCPDGSNYNRTRVVCTPGADGRAQCRGTNLDDGSDFRVSITR